MRIVHLGKYYPPHRGGIERVVAGLARGLSERGCDVTVVVSNDNEKAVDERIGGVRVIRVARHGILRSQPISFGLTRVLSKLDFDVLHVHTPNPLGSLAALAALRRRPLVVSHHSDIVQQRVLRVAGNLAQRALYARAQAIVAATPLHVRYSNVLGRYRARCRVIPFGLQRRPNGVPAAPPLPALWREQPFALFVGRLVHYKGLHVLLDAVSRVQGVRLAVVGSGPLEAELSRQVRARSLEERVAFLGDVDDAELSALYAACRFLVLPSTAESEAFGMVQLEAMAAGRAVISTNLRSGVPYVNQHLRTGLIVPAGDAAALALAMDKLWNDPDLCARLGLAGAARVEREFAQDRILDQWLALYSELADRR